MTNHGCLTHLGTSKLVLIEVASGRCDLRWLDVWWISMDVDKWIAPSQIWSARSANLRWPAVLRSTSAKKREITRKLPFNLSIPHHVWKSVAKTSNQNIQIRTAKQLRSPAKAEDGLPPGVFRSTCQAHGYCLGPLETANHCSLPCWRTRIGKCLYGFDRFHMIVGQISPSFVHTKSKI